MRVVCCKESFGYAAGIGDTFWIEDDLPVSKFESNLTPGKQYDVLNTRNFGSLHPKVASTRYLILNDDGVLIWYNKDLFISLEEFRSSKLTQLGI